jgi:hypothetical protein
LAGDLVFVVAALHPGRGFLRGFLISEHGETFIVAVAALRGLAHGHLTGTRATTTDLTGLAEDLVRGGAYSGASHSLLLGAHYLVEILQGPVEHSLGIRNLPTAAELPAVAGPFALGTAGSRAILTARPITGLARSATALPLGIRLLLAALAGESAGGIAWLPLPTSLTLGTGRALILTVLTRRALRTLKAPVALGRLLALLTVLTL